MLGAMHEKYTLTSPERLPRDAEGKESVFAVGALPKRRMLVGLDVICLLVGK